ncbi:MAG: extracellular solute-binding protein [Clostridia bacterium]|nr:extracellular solute-binding protein [Clostridia bacterium]
MKHTPAIRVLAALAALLMTAPLAACAGDNAGTTDTTASAVTTAAPTSNEQAETQPPVDENGFLLDNLPADLSYGGATLTVLADEGQKKQYFAEDLTGDIVNDALYERERTVEERLGVNLEWNFIKGAWANRDSFAQTVEQSVQAGSQDYDLVVAYNLTPPVLAVKGVLENLNDMKYIEVDQPWWPQTYVEQALYDDKLYCLAESSSRGVLRNMPAVFYNKELTEQYGMNDLLQVALDGDWTLDKLGELIKGTYRDLNGNNTVDAEDQFGLSVGAVAWLDAFFYGSGLTITKVNEQGNPELTLGDEKVQTYIDKILPFLNESPDVYPLDAKQYQMFKSGRAVFYVSTIAITDQLRDVDINYGVMPMPKFDANQEAYHTTMSNTHDVWCIPINGKNTEAAGAALEALASGSYRQVYPAYYETALKVKYAPDDQIAQVYDMIRAGVMFDFGYIYSNCFDRMPALYVRDCVQKNDPNWSSVWAAQKDSMTLKLDEILKALAD